MYKIAVIGAGQLGSRHLQGLKLSKLNLEYWVVDNNSNSLQIAQQRYEEGEVNSNQTIYYLQLIEQLPTELKSSSHSYQFETTINDFKKFTCKSESDQYHFRKILV